MSRVVRLKSFCPTAEKDLKMSSLKETNGSMQHVQVHFQSNFYNLEKVSLLEKEVDQLRQKLLQNTERMNREARQRAEELHAFKQSLLTLQESCEREETVRKQLEEDMGFVQRKQDLLNAKERQLHTMLEAFETSASTMVDVIVQKLEVKKQNLQRAEEDLQRDNCSLL